MARWREVVESRRELIGRFLFGLAGDAPGFVARRRCATRCRRLVGRTVMMLAALRARLALALIFALRFTTSAA